MKKNFVILFLFSFAFIATNCVKKGVKEEWAIVLHGGAGSAKPMEPHVRQFYLDLLDQALEIGTSMLQEGADALDVATQVVVWLEDCPFFNAGKGAVTTMEGIHELDAAIMDGRNLQAGAVAGLRDIKNPILAARHVMEDSPHVLLIGEGASAFAAQMGLTVVENSYFSTRDPDPNGTVGCVVLDKNGNLAAATSTGGMSGKRWGRVGDVPVIGAGTYANNHTVAVSGTGHGELWIRRCVAFDISALMDYKGLSVEEAAAQVIFEKIDPMEGSGGGVICVDKEGNIAMEFNTGMMYRAWATAGGERGAAIE
ncbi:MAG: isoaspartyl peptidase/L-asparaginase [Bacteroidales bacterium]|nr:isoaspartyl peptidase/L-asparaginase [Bacteroidales bacterium]